MNKSNAKTHDANETLGCQAGEKEVGSLIMALKVRVKPAGSLPEVWGGIWLVTADGLGVCLISPT